MTAIGGITTPSGTLGFRVLPRLVAIRTRRDGTPSLLRTLAQGLPRRGLDRAVFWWRVRNLPHLLAGSWRLLVASLFRLPVHHGALYLRVRRRDGTVLDLGLAGLRVVTTAGVNFLVDALQGTVEPEILKYHGLGTGTTAEAVGDTALVTELTTEYETDNVRPTGTLAEGASANIFRTVGTITVDATVAATEHGIFSQAAAGGGTLLDRTVFTVVNLASGDSLQATYELTLTAGS